MTQANYIFLLLLDLALTVGISFLCSILESVLMSTPLSFISMREEEGYKPATLFKKYKTDIDRPIAAILAMNTIANTFGAPGWAGCPLSPRCSSWSARKSSPRP